MLIAVIALAVLIGLAVAAYFLYETMSKKPNPSPVAVSTEANTVNLSLRLVDERYTLDLENFRSTRYVTLSRSIIVQLDSIFSQDSSLGKDYQQCVIEDFRPGSVKADLRVIYNKKFEVPFLEQTVTKVLNNRIKSTPNGHMLGRFNVDKDIEVKAVMDTSYPPEPAGSTSRTSPTPLETTALPTTTRVPDKSTRSASTTNHSKERLSTSTTMRPTTTPTLVSTPPLPTTATCESIWVEQCKDPIQVPYEKTTFPNMLGHATQEEAGYGFAGLLSVLDAACHPFARRLVCSVLIPECVQGDELTTLSPCQDLCTSVMTKCMRDLPQEFIDGVDCASLPNSNCISAPPLQPSTLRLADGAGPFEGRVEIEHDGVWGTICDDGFDERDAQVICRQMGYRQGGTPRRGAYFTQGLGQIWLSSVQCEGSERHLAECLHGKYGKHHCAHSEDAGVTCHSDAPEITIETRLVGGQQQHEGRVEVYYKGRWGPVCDDHFTVEGARTVCRSLGISDLSVSRIVSNSDFTPSDTTVWLDDVGCEGTEISLALCSHSPWGQHNCAMDHSEDVAVSCLPRPTTTTTTTSTTTSQSSTPTSTTLKTTTDKLVTGPTKPVLQLKLRGGLSPLHGHVVVFHNNKWGGICDDRFEIEDATVVCRMLNYSGDSISLTSSANGPSLLWLDEVNCDGDELSLVDCEHNDWGDHDCTSREAVIVNCGLAPTTTPTVPPSTTPTPIANVTIYLVVGPDELHGRLEVLHERQRGTVCDDEFDELAAKVVCQMLGYSGDDITYGSELYEDGSGDVLMDDLRCNGMETTIAACEHAGWGTNNCQHAEDIGINCGPMPTMTTTITTITSTTTRSPQTPTAPTTTRLNVTGSTGPQTELRLHGGQDEAIGTLQAYVGGIWTPVCARQFSDADTVAVCIKLGFGGFTPKKLASPSTPRNTTLGVTCGNISSCMPSELETTECTTGSTISLSCVSVRVRLADSTIRGVGRPEVFAQGSWGTICDDEFDNDDAKVLCRMLGYNGIALKEDSNLVGPGPESLAILLDNLECSGEEESIFDCPHAGIDQSNCNHHEDVAIKCLIIPEVPTPLPIRLLDGQHPLEGVLEVQHNGTWGGVCADGFTLPEAIVACKMLNTSGNVTVLESAGSSNAKHLWLEDISCTGREGSLADCNHSPWEKKIFFCFSQAMISCGQSPLEPSTVTPTLAATTTTPMIATTAIVPAETRLAGTSVTSEGRVEVRHDRKWGTVCRDEFGAKEAQVICRSLGFNDSTKATVIENTLPILNSSIPILLDSVTCTGSETNIAFCAHDGWGRHDCHHRDDVIVQCLQLDVSDLEFRLTGASYAGAGRLEVRYHGKWGTVCDDGFTDRGAEVACRSFGFENAEDARHLMAGPFGSGSGLIWLNHVTCSGEEASILDCPHDAWGQHNCQTNEAVSIECHPQVTTTRISPREPPIAAYCEEISIDHCHDILPYNYVALPNILGHQTQEEVVKSLANTQWHHIFAECESPDLALFVCSLLLPDCEHNGEFVEGKPPCASLCKRAESACKSQLGSLWSTEWSCDGLLDKNPVTSADICFDRQTEGAGQCQPIHVPFCTHGLPYHNTQLPNTFQHQSQTKVQQAAALWLGLTDVNCHPKIRLLVCSLYTPRCPSFPGIPILSPCMNTCLQVKEACSPYLVTAWPQEVNCHNLPDPLLGQACDPLLHIEPRSTQSAPGHSTSNTPSTNTPAASSTTVEGEIHCEPMESGARSICSDHVSYLRIGLPNQFDQRSQSDVLSKIIPFIGLTENLCDALLKPFACQIFFPQCDESGRVLQPCASQCEAVKAGCDIENLESQFGFGWPLNCTSLPTDCPAV